MPAWFANLLRDQSGQGLVEYALVLTLIAVVCVAALAFLGKRSSNVYSNITTAINAATN